LPKPATKSTVVDMVDLVANTVDFIADTVDYVADTVDFFTGFGDKSATTRIR